MTLEQMTMLARCNGMHTMTFRASEHSDGHETLLNSKKIKYIVHDINEHNSDH